MRATPANLRLALEAAMRSASAAKFGSRILSATSRPRPERVAIDLAQPPAPSSATIS